MNGLPDWLLPTIAAVVAAAMVPLLARSGRGDSEGPPAQVAPTKSALPFVLAGFAIAAMVWWVGERPGPAVVALVLWQGAGAILRARRQREMAEREERHAIQAIGAASRSLRAGIPLAAMLQMLADESEGRTRQALREVVQRESLGEELSSAIRQVLLRSPLASLRAFGLALVVQGSAGGNLADATDRLAMSLVERGRVRRRARTIMSYSRNASRVLAVTPLVAIPVLAWAVDGYTRVLLDRPEGNLILAAAAIMLTLGLLTIQRMSRIEPLPEGGPR